MLLVALMLFSLQSVSFAAYETQIPSNVQGNSSNLIYIKRPQKLSADTSDRTYTISAVGPAGTTIRVYKQTSGSSDYKLVKGAQKIGASGLYSTVMNLQDGDNYFIVYAERFGNSQVVRLTLSKTKQSTVDKLKSVTVNILNFLR